MYFFLSANEYYFEVEKTILVGKSYSKIIFLPIFFLQNKKEEVHLLGQVTSIVLSDDGSEAFVGTSVGIYR